MCLDTGRIGKYWEVVRNKKVAERKVRLKALEDEKTKAGPSKQ